MRRGIAESAMIEVLMPSPIGHALAGLAVAWTSGLVTPPDSRRGNLGGADGWPGRRLVLTTMALAAAPDLDLLLPGAHRTATHSLAAAVAVTIIAAAVTGQVTRWRTAVLCGISYASHLLLDWLAADNYPPRGIELLWPFSDRWFISGLDLFIQTERRRFLTFDSIRTNLTAMAWEALVLSPLLLALWLVRVKALARFAPELTRRDHSA